MYVCYMTDIYLHLMRFSTRSDELLNPNYGRSAIGAERPILIPSHVVRDNEMENENENENWI